MRKTFEAVCYFDMFANINCLSRSINESSVPVFQRKEMEERMNKMLEEIKEGEYNESNTVILDSLPH